jgi:hypothetical protein
MKISYLTSLNRIEVMKFSMNIRYLISCTEQMQGRLFSWKTSWHLCHAMKECRVAKCHDKLLILILVFQWWIQGSLFSWITHGIGVMKFSMTVSYLASVQCMTYSSDACPWVTWRVSNKKQELPTLLEHLGSLENFMTPMPCNEGMSGS